MAISIQGHMREPAIQMRREFIDRSLGFARLCRNHVQVRGAGIALLDTAMDA